MALRTDVSNGDGTEMHRELPLPQGDVEREAAEHAICGSPLCCVGRKRATPTLARVPLVDGLTCPALVAVPDDDIGRKKLLARIHELTVLLEVISSTPQPGVYVPVHASHAHHLPGSHEDVPPPVSFSKKATQRLWTSTVILTGTASP